MFPFAGLYALVTFFRNKFYDVGWFKSTSFQLPIIAVGNLSVGGTGKTPMVEYLIELLSSEYSVATLSRGYKRVTKGFVLAKKDTSVSMIGDEPFQFFSKFSHVKVAVCESRIEGVNQLLTLEQKTDVILLDDAFQHRKIKAGKYIILTTYNNLYVDDFILPVGSLRELHSGSKRADIIIVTKCPILSVNDYEPIVKKLNVQPHQEVFFTSIMYDDYFRNESQKVELDVLKHQNKLIVTGIADGSLFVEKVKNSQDEVLSFNDHHHFTQKDVDTIIQKAQSKPIVTTEKDYMKLKGFDFKGQLFYLPIKTEFLNNTSNKFNKIIKQYVQQNIRNISVS